MIGLHAPHLQCGASVVPAHNGYKARAHSEEPKAELYVLGAWVVGEADEGEGRKSCVVLHAGSLTSISLS